ncbi:Fe(3+) dicitrate ABC transporter substrate-binding protein [Photobacterium atrarenae]|uniref:Fe(3+) dicitrate ABC transporter substrate-binding protein n=1 Tax=Photobacterium atrarenae TaxID=865757 RepID=A0ABY5GLN9_9GAMM|nr:Fe(3+) dicitrate ABC transporter substrate-binding protein [Photobacterium atrarenae]UTV30015.1 Fe(3+) dicitrate ABC transporter substrate-binding protein [Photobacterium atrarenae]
MGQRAYFVFGLLVTLLGSLLSSASVSAADTRTDTRTVRGEIGEVTLTGTPTRIVALEFSFVDAMAAVGVAPLGIADDGKPERLIPAVKAVVPTWHSVGSRYQPSLEAIAELKPDLIIADLERHSTIYQDLSRIAPTLVLKSRGETYQENLEAVITLAKAINKSPEMAARLAQHRETMAAFKAEIQAPGTVQFAVLSERGMWMHGPASYAGSVLDSLGIKGPIPEQTEQAYIPTSLEQLLAANPDWLLIGRYSEQTPLDEWQSSPMYSLLRAVKHDRVVEVSPGLWSLSRGMLAAEGMAENITKLLNSQL